MIKRKQNKIISLIFICALCAFFGVTVSAQGVTDSAGLQAAINEASPGDTVSIAENITLTGTLAVNKSLTFKGENGNVSIFPETDARHMTVTGDNVVLKFDGVILDGGNTGGGIFSSADSLTLEDAEIKDCKAGNGGGIYSTKDLIIRDSRITGNKSSANGGGVYGFEHITISKTVLSGNTAAENGGAVYIDDHAKLATDKAVGFSGNKAAAAHEPPTNAAAAYPNIHFDSMSVASHPLNNYDINYTAGDLLTCHVTYNANRGGAGNDAGSFTSPGIAPGEEDTVLTLEATGITYANHEFTGWNTDKDGGGMEYAPGDMITLDGDVTLYAQWKEEETTTISHTETTSHTTTMPLTTDMTTTEMMTTHITTTEKEKDIPKTGDDGNGSYVFLIAGLISLSLAAAVIWPVARKRGFKI